MAQPHGPVLGPATGPGRTRILSRNGAGRVSQCVCCGRWQLELGRLVLVRDPAWFRRLQRMLAGTGDARGSGGTGDRGYTLEVAPGTACVLSEREVEAVLELVAEADRRQGLGRQPGSAMIEA